MVHTGASNLCILVFSLFIIHCSLLSAVRANTLLSAVSNTVDAITAAQDDYSCSKDKPCVNGACCGVGGYCGYNSTYCGDGCLSNCNATAECGEYASTPGAGCPLNVCCSEFGFCGTTSEFCSGGCQSHCTQPKPSASRSNVQKRVIGYWEAWNTDHACGTMGPGEIPVNMLTHLNIAFGYITPDDYRITNMDGVSPNLYRIVGDLKQRNPDLKILIALGGWTFNDPGKWQSVFPTMVSTKANRQKFIQNLLGFLSEYGYDGVDFDWEYPSADDRGGSSSDRDNFSELFKELRTAIKSSGRDYLVTFTSPTSYWYMRHFDIKTLTDNADWVNLMSYDIHGVWDSNNPIGNNVLAHTNLTEIDLALDLFWRNDVAPSKIVLGLGFYGRTFKLSDSSCWKPGCKFSDPGTKGPCTNTAGILSYYEINQILENTGGTAYTDKEAAVRYMVYDSDSWVSYDDESTFRLKIDYAEKMGLAGLMIWAIDLDDGSLDALSAVSGVNSTSSAFDLVPLEYIFPPNLLPSNDSKPSYGLVTVGSADSLSPNNGGFGFFLVTGESHAVSNLRKRDGEAEPFHFLDCPANVSDVPESHTRVARVVCLNDDTDGCFQVTEKGVEGTIVEMPENCAPNTFARAISLELSEGSGFRYKTSVRLDYATFGNYWDTFVDSPGEGQEKASNLMKRYWSNKTSNWQSLSHDNQFAWSSGAPISIKEDLTKLLWWQSDEKCDVGGDDYSEAFAAYVDGNIDAKMHYGFSLYGKFEASGELNIDSAHGFVNAAGKSDLKYAITGFGTVDVPSADKGNPAQGGTKTVSLKGSKIRAGAKDFYVNFEPYLKATYEMASFNGSEGSDTDFSDSVANFDGRMSARVVQDFSNITAYWPSDDPDSVKPPSGSYKDLEISIPTDGDNKNRLYYTDGHGGSIALGTDINFGVKISMQHVTYTPPALKGGSSSPNRKTTDIGTMALRYNTFTHFSFSPSDSPDDVCSDIQITSDVFQDPGDDSLLTDSGWGKATDSLGSSSELPSEGGVCYSKVRIPSGGSKKRDQHQSDTDCPKCSLPPGPEDSFDNSSLTDESPPQSQQNSRRDYTASFPGFGGDWEYKAAKTPPLWQLLPDSLKDRIRAATDAIFKPPSDSSCLKTNTTKKLRLPCCGCVPMDWTYSYSDIPPYDGCDSCPSSGNLFKWPYGELRGKDLIYKRDLDVNSTNELAERAAPAHRAGLPRLSKKSVTVCREYFKGADGDGQYPAFPKNVSAGWDGIENGRWDTISKYWGNTSEACWDWGVADIFPHDKRAKPLDGGGGLVPEHVLEAQTLGDFFTMWLGKGKITGQQPAPVNPSPALKCTLIKEFVLKRDAKWGKPAQSFFNKLLYEMGSIGHLDRLTIFLARPNGMKGNMFRGNNAIQYAKPNVGFNAKSADAQLQSVKEMGMVFGYLNSPKVWNKFCATYEAIYDLMGEFDDYHKQKGNTIVSLQDEWPKYIRTVLDSMSSRSKTAMVAYSAARAEKDSAYYSAIWAYNMGINYWKLTYNGTCTHLPRNP
ncbi:unnamed protein product [Penicillium salamii]|nr:unnamed protein product [Penicillium salamii]CAG8315850.1 unnamed protein product [Penicillium salamii]